MKVSLSIGLVYSGVTNRICLYFSSSYSYFTIFLMVLNLVMSLVENCGSRAKCCSAFMIFISVFGFRISNGENSSSSFYYFLAVLSSTLRSEFPVLSNLLFNVLINLLDDAKIFG